jgi:hypothetical protein|mmetsp:Transcript_82994/g.130916  ORF Transcript_82994/g.130916 Transcript_82994/m.130916 type:complete len:554 (-) Transcript_82994:112-1773(-)
MADLAADLKDRKDAFDKLSAALEAISVKNVMDFRNRTEVPRPVQSVAAASMCMVAGIGEHMEVGPDGLPNRSWEAAQQYMAKPGPFVNSLRQFPYAVDSGRMADKNVYAARQCLQDISVEHLADEPVALTLYQWITAAWRYCEVVQLIRLQSTAGRSDTQESLNTAAITTTTPTTQVIRGTPPREAGGMTIDGNGDLSYSPAQQLRTSVGSSQPVRTSLGSSVEGASVFAKTPSGTPATGSNRSSGVGGAANGKVTTRRPNPPSSGYAPRRSYDSKESSTLRVTPSGTGTPASGSPASTRSPASRRTGGVSSPSKPATIPRRTPPVSVGYPKGPRSNVGIEDWRQRLEKMQKEAREMRAMEAKMKWDMKREEDKTRKNTQLEDARDLADWRQQQENDIAEFVSNRNRKQKETELGESRDYQEFKRFDHNRQKEDELKEQIEDYTETKLNSEWEVELKRTVPLEENRERVDANLERITCLTNYNLQKERLDVQEARFDRYLEENTLMQYQLQKAKDERDAARESLKFFTTQQKCSIAIENEIPSRPIVPLDHTL